ncbi:MAG: response regulator transcription factor [Gammaproteobacteria bacterium]|jgi:DNA-binding response OmpR family regulator|nr:response regulator transcription factor [Xanthomonadaceae bacterium]
MKRDTQAGLILLVEDNRSLSEVVGEYFESKGFGVDYAGDGVDGYRLATKNSYDVIVLDLNLPRMDGLQVCRKLREEGKIATPVLMLTARDAVSDKVLGLEAGADDYLIKPFAIQELEARIRALIRRERRQVSTEVYKVADLILDTGSLRATRGGRDLTLSPIALRLLGILMRESPRVVTRRDIEREIWGDELPESDTLRSHLYNLRKAVDRGFEKQLLHTVQTAGYRIVDLDEQPKA